MITRMEMTYRSKYPCDKRPLLFTTGQYTVKVDGREFSFDFEDMEASTEIKEGYLYIDVLQKNLDKSLFEEIALDEADALLRKTKKEDFTEIYYECFGDNDETDFIPLEPVDITFYDFSTTGDGSPIVVGGEKFINCIG